MDGRVAFPGLFHEDGAEFLDLRRVPRHVGGQGGQVHRQDVAASLVRPVVAVIEGVTGAVQLLVIAPEPVFLPLVGGAVVRQEGGVPFQVGKEVQEPAQAVTVPQVQP